MWTLYPAALIVALLSSSLMAGAQSVEKRDIPGIRNFSRVDATVGCGGATSPEAIAELQRLGFKSIVNLREAGEAGVELERSRAAAEALGVRYIHLPFNAAQPQTAPIDRFLEAVSTPANQPVYIHCGSANRVGALWYVKRVVKDRWPADKALAEAEAIGLSNPALKQYVQDYAARLAR